MNQPFGAMPSPFELANKNKSATVTMSLRIKQTTKDFFEQQAKIIADSEANEGDKEKLSKTSASSLMNNLLDGYAESYTQRVAEAPITTVLKPYLENMAKKILVMDNESLIFRAFRPGKASILNFWEFENYSGVAQLLVDFKMISKKEHDENLHSNTNYPVIQTDNRDIWVCCVGTNGDGMDAEFEMNVDDESDYYRYIISVVPEKWPTVIATVDSYVRKIQEMTGEKDEDFSFSTERLKELVDVINSTDDKEELVNKLIKFFVSYAEQVYE